jgi:hypothetical protein
MTDLTLLYYTANKIEDYLGENVRKHLLEINANKYPLISVSQKPLDFGQNICVGEIGMSYYNCYKQILEGAKIVKTKYVALCEDDTLYSQEHFSHRPSNDEVFSFNKNMWYAEEIGFWNKGRTGMCTCIVSTKYLIDTLTPRFIKYPESANLSPKTMLKYFQEPGRFDGANIEYFKTKIPILTFNYFHALGGKAGSFHSRPTVEQSLVPWGDAWELKKKFWGRARPRGEGMQNFGYTGK